MRFPYTVTGPAQTEFDSLPRLPLTLQLERHRVEAVGLVDSGATVNVLPYDIGLQLGESWEDRKAPSNLQAILAVSRHSLSLLWQPLVTLRLFVSFLPGLAITMCH